MEHVVWRPGAGWAVVGDDFLAWLPAAPAELLRGLHAAAAAGRAEELLVASTLSFALFRPSGRGGPMIRGAVGAGAWDDAGVPVADGTAGRVVLGAPAGDAAAYPIVSGVVGCGSLEWRRDVTRAAAEVRGAAPAAGAPAPARAPVAVEASGPEGDNPFASLWGQTMKRPVEAAAVRVVRDGDPGSSPEPVDEQVDEPVPATTPPAVAPQPARAASTTTRLLSELDDVPDLPADHGEVVGPDGTRCAIRGLVVVGRAPRALPGEDAGLLRVASPERSISRSHVVVRGTDGAVAAKDLSSNNGTFLVRNGHREPLRVDAWTPVASGDLLDLGEGVVVRLVGLP